MYICKYIYMYLYIYIHIYIYVHTYIYTYIYICTYTHSYVYTFICIYTHTSIHIAQTCTSPIMHVLYHDDDENSDADWPHSRKQKGNSRRGKTQHRKRTSCAERRARYLASRSTAELKSGVVLYDTVP